MTGFGSAAGLVGLVGLIGLVGLLGLAVAGSTAALAIAIRRSQRRANQVVPGVESPAPASWAGAHSPEARLHRRLRDAMAGLRTIVGTSWLAVEGLADLDQWALELDRRLVATAAIPESARAAVLAKVTAQVEALETAAAGLADQVATDRPPLDDVVRGLSERLGHLADARAELDALADPGPPSDPPPPADPSA